MTCRRIGPGVVVLALAASLLAATTPAVMPVTAVEAVGFTVSNMERSLRFYTSVLPFVRVSDIDVDGRPYELLTGVFGARARIVRLRLGDEQIELTEFLAPRGRPIPDDIRANDRVFQHAAIVVSDMTRAYLALRGHGVAHASTGPQRLPEWNPNAGGIGAFYFRDPDGHFLELISFPPGKGLPRWQQHDAGLFLGIDHTAIVVDDTDAALRLYRDTLGLRVVGESENYDVEQEHLNNVFGARLRITALRAAAGPGIELLEYLAPRDGRPAPIDLRANDIAHWETTVVTHRIDQVLGLARAHRLTLVSPGPVLQLPTPMPLQAAALTRDRDGHALRVIRR